MAPARRARQTRPRSPGRQRLTYAEPRGQWPGPRGTREPLARRSRVRSTLEAGRDLTAGARVAVGEGPGMRGRPCLQSPCAASAPHSSSPRPSQGGVALSHFSKRNPPASRRRATCPSRLRWKGAGKGFESRTFFSSALFRVAPDS